MQLKRPKRIRGALTMATSTLLSSVAVAQTPTRGVEVDVSGLRYAETDRVTVNKYQVQASKALPNEDVVRVGVVYDTMTGASPNGRYRLQDDTSSSSLIVTSASGHSFEVANDQDQSADLANSVWLTRFEDQRRAASLEWERAWRRNVTTIFGAVRSTENDYLSNGANATVVVDLNDKNTTVTAGAGTSFDTVDPEGGVPKELGTLVCASTQSSWAETVPDWIDCYPSSVRYKAGEKVVQNYLVGVSQVWNPRTVLQVNYSRGEYNGYLTDPYKQISAIGQIDVSDPDVGEAGVVYEKRPSYRATNSLYFKLVHVPTKDAAHFSFRYFWDSWGIHAQTLDARMHLEFTPRFYLQPHLRLSRQSAADFFVASFDHDDAKPVYASADHRLGEQVTVTAGAKLGMTFSKDLRIGIRGEYLNQKYQGHSLPDMKGVIVQFLLTSTL